MKNDLKITYKGKEIEISKETRESFLKALVNKSRKPEKGDEYWSIVSNGIFPQTWDNNETDIARYNYGNCFKTEEKAEKELAKREAIVRVKDYIYENFGEFEPDWENDDEWKLTIHYCYEIMTLEWSLDYSEKHYSSIGYLHTGVDCDQLIEDCKEDLEIIYK